MMRATTSRVAAVTNVLVDRDHVVLLEPLDDHEFDPEVFDGRADVNTR